jgi:hypothetical protein
MKGRGNIFWGTVIVLIGILFLANTTGLITINIWRLIWPLFLILAGVWFLIGFYFRGKAPETEEIGIPLDNIQRAEIILNHGAGHIKLGASSDNSVLLNGKFAGGIDYKVRSDNVSARVKLKTPDENWFDMPWGWGRSGLDWDIALNRSIPLSLEVNTGASESILDLSDLKIEYLKIGSGASSNEVMFPMNSGLTKAKIGAGAASIKIHIPESVEARIQVKSGISNININPRFTQNGDIYQSASFDTAHDKADIEIEAGVGSVQIN